MAQTRIIRRPRRWDNPFSPAVSDADVDRVLSEKPFSEMDASKFPESASLRDIVRNDTRLITYQPGDIIVRAGDYGTSAFLVLSGAVRVVLPPGLPNVLLGREELERKGVLEALAQLWRRPRWPEVRDVSRYAQARGTGARQIGDDETRIFLRDIDKIIEHEPTVPLGPGEMFGEIAALARVSRTTTVFAEEESQLLEVRWQGIRDIGKRHKDFRDHLDRLYRDRSLKAHLRETPVFQNLNEEVIEKIAKKSLFESYGDFDWQTSYRRIAEQGPVERLLDEPVIAHEGDYPDGLLMIISGFARVSYRINHGEYTVRYVGGGGIFGFEEIVHNWRHQDTVNLNHTLRASGHADVVRVPTAIIEEYVLPSIPRDRLPPRVERRRQQRGVAVERREAIAPSTFPEVARIAPELLEFFVDYRYSNGTATMLIDLDRCVRCDACVEACAVGHNNNPRFNRHGQRNGKFMIANACMHCADPVCMLGCPTGAIHRSSLGGEVVINDDTCIGCATCANNCPYDNIRMVDIRDENGRFILNQATGSPVMKATKCDLCIDQPGGPACQRACPHDALVRIHMRDRNKLASWLNRS
jgi:Fe-S-cluster-containing dehydrogenase component/CRP-like cAMP-binding protein